MTCVVQQKIQCIFKSTVIEEPSKKRGGQDYRVIASETIRPEALDSDLDSAIPTEKLDGTCCMISEYMGRPWLWARYEKKMMKECEKRHKRYLNEKRMCQASGEGQDDLQFDFDMTRDFKITPDEWIPAKNVDVLDGVAQPDSNGHIPGWVPVHPSMRQQCWHVTTVDMEKSLALILRRDGNDDGLEIAAVPMSELMGRTLELIGTNINANPYGIGSKQAPQHYLVVHGSLVCRDVPQLNYQHLKQWFLDSPLAGVEGIVWHCQNGTMYKLHRHHVDLKWPVATPTLSHQPIRIVIDKPSESFSSYSLFHKLSRLDQKQYYKLTDLCL